MKTRLTAISLSLILLAQAPLTIAQGTQLSSDQAWELVKQTPLGEMLEVKLKNGGKVKAEMILASDSELSLSLKDQQTRQFKRDDLREVRRFLPPNPDKQKLYSGIGVGVGLIAALVGLPIAGSLIGRKLGGRGKRIVIYQAP